jgi:hypothetical protein
MCEVSSICQANATAQAFIWFSMQFMVVCERLVPVLIVVWERKGWPGGSETTAARRDIQRRRRSFGSFDGTDDSSGVLSVVPKGRFDLGLLLMKSMDRCVIGHERLLLISDPASNDAHFSNF